MSVVEPVAQEPRYATREHPLLRGPDREKNLAVEVAGVNHYFGQGDLRKQVLFNNRLSVARGEIVIMTGPSGSGKTTLLTLIGGLRTVQEGSLRVLGREMRGLSAAQLTLVRRDIGFIFQAHNLFESLTAYQNVRMAMELKDYTVPQMKERAEELLNHLGLGHRIHYKPQSLSGGQRQRVAIARAVSTRPRLILADEPTAALDKKSGRDVVEMLRTMAKEDGCTIIMVTHDNRILDVADRIVNMVDGHIASNVLVGESAAICEFLRRSSVFEKLTPSVLSNLADQMLIESHPPGTDIIRQGDPGDKFYVIRHGEAEVIIQRDDTPPRRVATLGEGAFFGEAALITGEPRNATVRSTSEIELYTLSKEQFQAVLDSSESFKEELLKVLFERQ